MDWLRCAVIVGFGHWPELPIAVDHILSASKSRDEEEQDEEEDEEEEKEE